MAAEIRETAMHALECETRLAREARNDAISHDARCVAARDELARCERRVEQWARGAAARRAEMASGLWQLVNEEQRTEERAMKLRETLTRAEALTVQYDDASRALVHQVTTASDELERALDAVRKSREDYGEAQKALAQPDDMVRLKSATDDLVALDKQAGEIRKGILARQLSLLAQLRTCEDEIYSTGVAIGEETARGVNLAEMRLANETARMHATAEHARDCAREQRIADEAFAMAIGDMAVQDEGNTSLQRDRAEKVYRAAETAIGVLTERHQAAMDASALEDCTLADAIAASEQHVGRLCEQEATASRRYDALLPKYFSALLELEAVARVQADIGRHARALLDSTIDAAERSDFMSRAQCDVCLGALCEQRGALEGMLHRSYVLLKSASKGQISPKTALGNARRTLGACLSRLHAIDRAMNTAASALMDAFEDSPEMLRVTAAQGSLDATVAAAEAELAGHADPALLAHVSRAAEAALCVRAAEKLAGREANLAVASSSLLRSCEAGPMPYGMSHEGAAHDEIGDVPRGVALDTEGLEGVVHAVGRGGAGDVAETVGNLLEQDHVHVRGSLSRVLSD